MRKINLDLNEKLYRMLEELTEYYDEVSELKVGTSSLEDTLEQLTHSHYLTEFHAIKSSQNKVH